MRISSLLGACCQLLRQDLQAFVFVLLLKLILHYLDILEQVVFDQRRRVRVFKQLHQNPNCSCLKGFLQVLHQDVRQSLAEEQSWLTLYAAVEFHEVFQYTMQVRMPEQWLQFVVNMLLLLDLSEHFVDGVTFVYIAQFNSCSQCLGQQMVFLSVHEVIQHVFLEEGLKWLGESLKKFKLPNLRILL